LEGKPDDEALPSIESAQRQRARRKPMEKPSHGSLKHDAHSRQEFFEIFRTEHKFEEDSPRRRPKASQQQIESSESPGAELNGDIEQKLTALYRSIDKDFSNSVDARELWEGLAGIGFGLDQNLVQKLVVLGDTDGDGSLDLVEFLVSRVLSRKYSAVSLVTSELVCCPQGAFTTLFGSTLPTGRKIDVKNDRTLVKCGPELSAMTKKVLATRNELEPLVWQYIQDNELQTRTGSEVFVELDYLLWPVFGLDHSVSIEDGGKSLDNSTISLWQLEMTMSGRIDENVTAVHKQLSEQDGDVHSDQDDRIFHRFRDAVALSNDSDAKGLPLTARSEAVDFGTPSEADETLETPRTAFLRSVRERCLLPIPLPITVMNTDNGFHSVQLRGISLSPGYTNALADAFRQFPNSITTVNFCSNGMEDSEGRALIESLANKTSLTSINFSGNKLGPQAASGLGALLGPMDMRLQVLHLASNNLRDAGCKLLVTAMLSGSSWSTETGARHYPNRTVTDLDLQQNDIGNSGGVALATLLDSNRTLTRINLGCVCYVASTIDQFLWCIPRVCCMASLRHPILQAES
jgi:hypothetical protein